MVSFGQPPVQHREPFAVVPGQLRAGSDEVEVVALDQPDRLGVETRLPPLLVHRVDPVEQPLVQEDGVMVRGQARRQFGFQGEQLVSAVRGDDIEEHARRAAQQTAGPLHRLDRIGEVRSGGILDDGVDLGELLDHPAVERLAVFGHSDPGERRHSNGSDDAVSRGLSVRSAIVTRGSRAARVRLSEGYADEAGGPRPVLGAAGCRRARNGEAG